MSALDNTLTALVALALYPIAYAFQMLPDGEQSTPTVQENPDAPGYFMGDPPNWVEEIPVVVPDTFPEEWCYV